MNEPRLGALGAVPPASAVPAGPTVPGATHIPADPAQPSPRPGRHGQASTTDVNRSGTLMGGRGVRRSIGAGARRSLRAPDSIWWLVIVAMAFITAELAFASARPGLAWDEAVYVSQLGRHAPAAGFASARARGVTLLVAPVTLLTSSTAALRVYLSVLSGLALFGALLVWRRLRPAWVLALAGLIFGSLWVVQYYGPRAMPNLWFAFGGFAAVGFFLRAAGKLGCGQQVTGRPWGELTGLAACLAFAALTRPGDAVFLAIPLGGAVLLVRPWRHWQLLAAVAAGVVAGAAEWVVEAFVRWGGPISALHSATAMQGGHRLYLGVWAELRVLDGPIVCLRPCTVRWEHPQLTIWWLALPALVALGLAAARRAGRLSSAALAAVCGFSVALQYLFLIYNAAPRYLIPMYLLFAVPVADGLAWLLTGLPRPARLLTGAAVAAVLLAQIVTQHHVLNEEVAAPDNGYSRAAADLHSLGVEPPCLIKGILYIPIAYYAGCASAPGVPGTGSAIRVAVIGRSGSPPPRAYADGWARHRLSGTRFVAYLAR